MPIPTPISLDFQRDYKFMGVLLPHGATVQAQSLITDLWAIAKPLYVSSMLKKVDFPDSEIEMEQVNYTALTTLYPKGYTTNSIQCEYMEDSFGLIYNFFKTWQERVRGESSKMTFKELGKVCLSFVYSNTVSSIPIDVGSTFGSQIGADSLGNDILGAVNDIPVNATVYPMVFPSKVAKGTFDKSGNSLVSISVTLVRVPRIKFTGSRINLR